MSTDKLDGGYAWVTAVSGMLLQTLHTSLFSVFGMIYIHMVEYYETTKSTISLIGAVEVITFGLTGLCVGPLLRKYGRRRVGLVAPFLVSFGYLMAAFSTQLWQMFLTMGVLVGMGLAMYVSVALATIYRWFLVKQTLGLSIVILGSSVGTFLWPLLTSWMISVYGWKGSLIITSAVHLHGFVLISLFRNPRNCQRVQAECKKVEIPLEEQQKELHKFPPHWREIESVESPGEDTETKTESDKGTGNKTEKKKITAWLVLFKNPAFCIYSVGQFLIYFGHLVPYTYTAPRAILLGYSENEAAVLSSMIGICGGIGRLLGGTIGVRISKTARICGCALSATVCSLLGLLSMASNAYWFLAGYSVLWGIVHGFYILYLVGGAPDLFGSVFVAELMGINVANAGIASFSSGALTGYLLDKLGNPSLPFAVTGGIQMLGAACMLISLKCQRQKEKHTSNPMT